MTAIKTEARLKIERMMQAAPVGVPQTAKQIAYASGVHIELVRTHVATACGNGLAHNLRKGMKGAGLYASGEREFRVPANVGAPRQSVSTARYAGERATPIREGAMRGYQLCSLENGIPVERKRPAIMSARVQAVGVHGGRAV